MPDTTLPITADERAMAAITHLSGLAGYIIPLGGVIVPIVIWLTRRDSPAISSIAKQAVLLNLFVFTLIVEAEDGSEVLRVELALGAGERAPMNVNLPPLTGRHRFVLQTEMAPGAPHNYNAWARWLSPRVL